MREIPVSQPQPCVNAVLHCGFNTHFTVCIFSSLYRLFIYLDIYKVCWDINDGSLKGHSHFKESGRLSMQIMASSAYSVVLQFKKDASGTHTMNELQKYNRCKKLRHTRFQLQKFQDRQNSPIGRPGKWFLLCWPNRTQEVSNNTPKICIWYYVISDFKKTLQFKKRKHIKEMFPLLTETAVFYTCSVVTVDIYPWYYHWCCLWTAITGWRHSLSLPPSSLFSSVACAGSLA